MFDEVSGFSRPGPAVPDRGTATRTDAAGRRYVDLDDAAEFDRYLLARRAMAQAPMRTAHPVALTPTAVTTREAPALIPA